MKFNRASYICVLSLAVVAFDACKKSGPPPGQPSTLLVFRDGIWFAQPALNPRGLPAARVGNFGGRRDLPIVADFNNAGRPHLGVFRQGTWFTDLNDDAIWDPRNKDVAFVFGQAGDIPVAADWDGSGKTRIGVFRNGQWFLDSDGNLAFDGRHDRIVSFGQAGDYPVVGDWDGSGKTRIGVFRNGQWFLDSDGNFRFDDRNDRIVSFGQAGDFPAVMTRRSPG